MAKTTRQRITGYDLDASEVAKLNPDWAEAMVEDYLSLRDSIIIIADALDIEINTTIEEIPTLFSDGSIPYADGGFLSEDNAKLVWDAANSILKIVGVLQSKGRIKGTVYVTSAMSPYTVLLEDEVVICDTDITDIALTLPAGTSGEAHKITSAGSLNNVVNITPFGTEKIEGDNATLTIYDTETLNLEYEENTGWWA